MSLCFATMAVGNEYITLALKLVSDIHKYFPESTIYVLTDSPDFFKERHIKTVNFTKQGYWYLYHEKQQVIKAATQKYSHCLFLDADCRLTAQPPIEEYQQLPDGLYGAYAQTFDFKFDAEISRYTGNEQWLKNTPNRRKKLLQRYCQQLNINFSDCNFLQEACLLVAGTRSANFLDLWNYMGQDLSARKFEWGEGFIYGISANYLKISCDFLPKTDEWLFKDNLGTTEQRNQPIYQSLLQERKEVSQLKWRRKNKALLNLYGLIRFAFYAPIWHLFKSRIALKKILNKSDKQ